MANLCEQVIDVEEGQLCNQPAVSSITVTNRSGKFKVWVCTEHKAQSDRTFAQMRRTESKR